jgi:hypothetical protein
LSVFPGQRALKRDLCILVPGRNEEFALRGALGRPRALGIRAIDFGFKSHPGRDGGVRTDGPALLSSQRLIYDHALMLLDHEGSGASAGITAIELERQLDAQLASAWGKCAKAIVVAPELDVWLWGAENALKQALDWSEGSGIRDWLKGEGFEFTEQGKPVRPKEAFESVARELRVPRSSALYEAVTSKISLARCSDPAFARLRKALQTWFGSGHGAED